MVSAESILSDKKLRITQSRKAVIDSFLESRHALSQPDLEKQLENTCDRVTIYRILDSFMQHGILHKVPDLEGTQKYALCDACNDHHHHDEHLHFKCNRCGRTECLDEIPMPTINLPSGYQVEEWNMLLQGICGDCASA
ncbi:MAG: transcriptional repressor [Bacteroidota bacterium]|nr:transcriptional repressor [Bacteroidota bacterium]MDX5431900.1 transcriptional repressor [Bacteroidota bacterium]MDX5470614.1 transcriptional repressor [Bacteroidota bacterium]